MSTGRNSYFVLEPGYVLVLENRAERLTITVLNETRKIDNVETRVVEERETRNGVPVEISRNYFAISKRTKNVYYEKGSVEVVPPPFHERFEIQVDMNGAKQRFVNRIQKLDL